MTVTDAASESIPDRVTVKSSDSSKFASMSAAATVIVSVTNYFRSVRDINVVNANAGAKATGVRAAKGGAHSDACCTGPRDGRGRRARGRARAPRTPARIAQARAG